MKNYKLKEECYGMVKDWLQEKEEPLSWWLSSTNILATMLNEVKVERISLIRPQWVDGIAVENPSVYLIKNNYSPWTTRELELIEDLINTNKEI